MSGIQCYAIAVDGTISKSQASMVSQGFQMAIDPQGTYLFSAAYGTGLVYGFAIASDCSLTSTGPATQNAALDLHGIAFDRQGNFLVVQSTSDVTVYALDRASGSIAIAQGPYPTDGYWLAFDVLGTRLFVAARDAGIRSYAFDRQTGALTATAGSPFRNGAGMYWFVALDPTGTYAYASSDADFELDPFRIAVSGALTALPTVPATALAYGMTIVTPQ
jgi:6-phosphogluconolactonase (cycloisomerase 2 family)